MQLPAKLAANPPIRRPLLRNQMINNNQAAASLQQRRKWSDWSECSVSCVKTRHRLNCDDILASTNSSTSTISSATTKHMISNENDNDSDPKQSKNLFQTKRDSSADFRALRGDTHDNNPSDLGMMETTTTTTTTADQSGDDNGNNNEEDDYADEPEDDEDSCATVDTSKTFEQIPCAGGACISSQSHHSHHHHHHHQQQQQSLSRYQNPSEKPAKQRGE